MRKLIMVMLLMFVLGASFCYADTKDICEKNILEHNSVFKVVSDNPNENFEDLSGVVQLYSSMKPSGKKYIYTIHAKYDVSKQSYLRYHALVKRISEKTKGMSDAEKVQYINRWFQKNVKYKDSYTAYDTLIKRNAVCEGYAIAFQVIAEESGLKSRFIKGIAGGEGHAWNIVKIDGRWYGVDVCWNKILKGENFGKKHEPLGDYNYKLANEDY